MNALLEKVYRRIRFRQLAGRVRDVTRHEALNCGLARVKSHPGDTTLINFYLAYVSEISRPDMAASLECIKTLLTLCRAFNCKKILELGSGFSSYALRRFASHDRSISIYSIDDNAAWLAKTEQYLATNRLALDNVMMLDDFLESGESDFDMIFFDLNFVEVRRRYIEMVVTKCRPGGLILFDDAHKTDYMYEVLYQTRRAPINFYDLRSFTRDAFGRFSLLGIKQA